MTEELSPYELIRQKYEFPPEIEDRDFQVSAVNALAPLPRSGWYAEPCTGKTFMATVLALYKQETAGNRPHIVLMPPILLDQWHEWLRSIKRIDTGQPLPVVIYRGKPKERRQIDLTAYDFVVMSLQIFKNDFEYLFQLFDHCKVTVLVDEAHSVKNPQSANHKRVRDFAEGRDLALLTGYPLTTPGDAYGYVKLVSPSVYRNQRHFEQLHVEERDFYGNVTKWSNLDFIAENMLQNSVRIFKRQALPYLKAPVFVPIPYQLDPEHLKLYKRLAEEQLLLLENGGKIDATTPTKLYHALQQIVMNPGFFSGDPNMRSAGLELLDQVIDELAVGDAQYGHKLMIFAQYRMTNRSLLQYLQPYGAVGFYSEVSQEKQQKNLRAFKEDKQCRIALAHTISAGYGLEGLQKVCWNAVFPEFPTVPKDFTQAVDRFDRGGQPMFPNIRLPIAQGTCQVRLQADLLKKDALVNRVQGGWQDLREAIYGRV